MNSVLKVHDKRSAKRLCQLADTFSGKEIWGAQKCHFANTFDGCKTGRRRMSSTRRKLLIRDRI